MNMDQIADMLTRIRNAQQAKKSDVVMPSSKFKVSLARLLSQLEYVGDISELSDGSKKFLQIQLNYNNGKGVINGLERVSRQGQRIYMNKSELPVVKNGYGVAIISTSQGLMVDAEARKRGLGGEIICKVW